MRRQKDDRRVQFGSKEGKILEEILQSAQWKVGAVKARRSPAMAERLSDDQELLRQLAKGNEGAFRTLYERYQGRLYRFALHMSGNGATAEETTQEVFLELMGKPKGYDPAKGSLAGYLFGMTRNITRRAMQETADDIPLDEDDVERDEFSVAGGLSVLEELSNGELLSALRHAVLTLPEPYREAVVLCDLEEMSYQEAAGLLECSPGTVASRLHRARTLLKKKLSVQVVRERKCAT
jgi:RNA polymerase sigma-70 factor, ECF subfamily